MSSVIRTVLRALVDLRDRQLQKARIQFGNRVAMIERLEDRAVEVQEELLRRYHDAFAHLERLATKDIAQLVQRFPIYRELAAVRGVGPTLAAKIIAQVSRIDSFTTVSKLWRYSGYAVVNGRREYPEKGKRLPYNARLKSTLYLVGTSFLRQRSPYRAVYDRARAYYDRVHPDWTPMHRHLAAQRKMVKLFLAHLWERWRRLEGLPTRPAYVHEKLGHTTVERPEAYGWRPLEASGDGVDPGTGREVDQNRGER